MHNLRKITSTERVLRTLKGRSGRALGPELGGMVAQWFGYVGGWHWWYHSAHWTCAYFKANFRKYVPSPVSAALRFFIPFRLVPFRILQRFSLIIQKIITLKNCLSLTGCEQPNPKLPSQTYRLRCHLQGRKNFEFALIFFGYLGWKGKLVAKNVIFILLLLIIARQVNRAYARETGCQRKVTGKHSPDMEYKRFGK